MEINKSNLRVIIHSKVGNLPTLSTVALKLLELANDDDAPIHDLVRLISHDQAIATRVLKVANSAYYGFARQVTNIDHAITLLGLEMISSLALSMKVIDHFKRLEAETRFDITDFWLHSIAVGGIARDFSGRQPAWTPDLLFTSGLLHDVGKLFLLDLMGDEYLHMVVKAKEGGERLATLETRLLGMDHAEVGGFLLERWKFPPAIVGVVREHHEMVAPAGPSLCDPVILADVIAIDAGLGASSAAYTPGEVDMALARMGLGQDEWQAMRADYLGGRGEEIRSLINEIL